MCLRLSREGTHHALNARSASLAASRATTLYEVQVACVRRVACVPHTLAVPSPRPCWCQQASLPAPGRFSGKFPEAAPGHNWCAPSLILTHLGRNPDLPQLEGAPAGGRVTRRAVGGKAARCRVVRVPSWPCDACRAGRHRVVGSAASCSAARFDFT